jgi:hypothetical protein
MFATVRSERTIVLQFLKFLKRARDKPVVDDRAIVDNPPPAPDRWVCRGTLQRNPGVLVF